MEVDCEGCAGCCLDWRPLADADLDHERRGDYRPLDDTYNLAPLTGDEVRAFLEAGHAAAMTPRLFRSDESSVTVGGVDLAGIDGRPAFIVGLRKVPKPVAPFDADPTWLPTCAFLDPETLQCRIHGGDLYPGTCAEYPGENLVLDVETECERVERTQGGERLLDDDPPDDVRPAFGPGAVGSSVFVHPDPDRILEAVRRFDRGAPTRADRAEFLAVAAAASPGTLTVDEKRYERARGRVLEAESWLDSAIADWRERADAVGVDAPDATIAHEVEENRGAPGTPGWNDVDSGTDANSGSK